MNRFGDTVQYLSSDITIAIVIDIQSHLIVTTTAIYEEISFEQSSFFFLIHYFQMMCNEKNSKL